MTTQAATHGAAIRASARRYERMEEAGLVGLDEDTARASALEAAISASVDGVDRTGEREGESIIRYADGSILLLGWAAVDGDAYVARGDARREALELLDGADDAPAPENGGSQAAAAGAAIRADADAIEATLSRADDTADMPDGGRAALYADASILLVDADGSARVAVGMALHEARALLDAPTGYYHCARCCYTADSERTIVGHARAEHGERADGRTAEELLAEVAFAADPDELVWRGGGWVYAREQSPPRAGGWDALLDDTARAALAEADAIAAREQRPDYTADEPRRCPVSGAWACRICGARMEWRRATCEPCQPSIILLMGRRMLKPYRAVGALAAAARAADDGGYEDASFAAIYRRATAERWLRDVD